MQNGSKLIKRVGSNRVSLLQQMQMSRTKRAIPNQEDFIYCKRAMDPVAAQQDAIIAAGLSDDFRSAIQNNPNMSQELRNALEQSIVQHSGVQ